MVLPADLAQEIGIKPVKGDAAEKTRVADGSEVEVHRGVIPTVRVGKFIIKDVECSVMPADRTNVAPLLGQSFLRHFTYKSSADSGTLVLSKVDTPAARNPAPNAKTQGRQTAGKRSPRKPRPVTPFPDQE